MSKWMMLLPFVALMLVGCGSKQDTPQSLLTGNWLNVSQNGIAQVEANSTIEIYSGANMYQEFQVRGRAALQASTYTVSGNNLTIVLSGTAFRYTFQVSSTQLTLTTTTGRVLEYRRISDAERDAIFARNP